MDQKPIRVLLVEDNPGDALLLQAALRNKAESRYAVQKVDRLRNCLDCLSGRNFDIVLLDLSLPDSSGLATLRAVLEAESRVPIVVLTGLGDKAVAIQSLHEGAQDFLLKDELNGPLLKRSISYALERYELLKTARENEERYFLTARGSHDGLWDWDLLAGRVFFSPRWKLMLGYSEDEIEDRPEEWWRRVHSEDLAQVRWNLSRHLSGKTSHFASEHRLRQKDGNYRWVLGRGMAIRDKKNRATRVAGSFTDITRHKNMEKQLALRAFYDPLTGLPNRPHFMENLIRCFEKLKRTPASRFALMFLDLDRFKYVNDHWGHGAGDQLLVELGQRLRSSVRPNDMVARMGGDEFTVLLEDLRNSAEATEVADRILVALRIPFRLGGAEVTATASIGIAYSAADSGGPDGLLRAADAAMYQAKVAGKGRYEVFREKQIG
ncbi:MAG: diguanylate cyclase domain-containing protein [bacterium]